MRTKRQWLAFMISFAMMMILWGYVIAPGACAAEENTPAQDKSIKILAIGNSFSQDAMQWQYQILEDAGYSSVTLGNLVIGGSSLQKHWGQANGDPPIYEYYKNTNGSWQVRYSTSIEYGIINEDWDVITLQQASPDSGLPGTYNPEHEPWLDNLVNYINNKKTNPTARLGWHMTWAYQQNCTYTYFSNYGNQQMTMYEAILSAVQQKIVPHEAFDFIIPTGTAIQNMRTSYVGDTLTRDGFHLSLYLGRYIAGMAWVKAVTGETIDGITYTPNAVEVPGSLLPVIKEAVNNAVATPFAVTPSSYSGEPATYTITYHVNGGTSLTLSSETKTHGVPLVLSGEATRSGMEFQGWGSKSNSPLEYETGGEYTEDKNATLYAIWYYRVNFDANLGEGETATTMPESFVKPFSQGVPLPGQSPSREGYTFVKWSLAKDGSGPYYEPNDSFSYLSTKPVTLYAVWEPVTDLKNEIKLGMYYFGKWTPEPASLAIIRDEKMILPRSSYTYIKNEAMANYAVEFELTEPRVSDNAYVMIQLRTPDEMPIGNYTQAVMFRANLNTADDIRYMVGGGAGEKILNSGPIWNSESTINVRLEILNGTLTVMTKKLQESKYVTQGAIPMGTTENTHVCFSAYSQNISSFSVSFDNVRLYREHQNGIWDPTPVMEDRFDGDYPGGFPDSSIWGNINSAGVNDGLKQQSWDRIRPFAPERQPLPDVGRPDGWYDSRDVAPMEQHIDWMADYGIDFMSMAWYWRTSVDQDKENPAVYAYLSAENRSRISYSLLWCNHDGFPSPTTLGEWEAMVDYWVDEHFTKPEYLIIEGKPVLFVFSPDGYKAQAEAIGNLIDIANARVRYNPDNGLDGIYFVLCAVATDHWVGYAASSGFSAISGYNYPFGVEGHYCSPNTNPPCNIPSTHTPFSHSFAERAGHYQMQWNYILRESALPYFLPMSAGWDSRPWGGSSDPLHDNSKSTPQEFEDHLRDGYNTISQNMVKTKGIGMLHCWNEFGEGAIIEPTVEYQFEYLEAIQRVFRQ